MKILLVHNDYQQAGGEQAAVDAQIALLRSYGNEVIIYRRTNTEIGSYGYRRKASFLRQATYSDRTYRDIRSLVADEHPPVAHVHNVFPIISPSVYHALKDARVPIVQTIHNFRLMCPNALFYTQGQNCERCKLGNTIHAIRWKCFRNSYALSAFYAIIIGLHRRWATFKMIDSFIALTDFTAQKLVESGLTTWEKITVLGNFLPDPLPQLGFLDRSHSCLVYMGRLSPEKGVDVLIKAVSGMPEIELKIAGEGPQAEELRSLSRHLNLKRVEFLRYVTGESKWQLLRKAAATVIPSLWYENFPVTLLESFAVGTPVITSRLGGLPYIVEEGINGLLFSHGDIDELRAKIYAIVNQPGEAVKMGQNGRLMIEGRYSASSHYEVLMKIYNQVVR